MHRKVATSASCAGALCLTLLAGALCASAQAPGKQTLRSTARTLPNGDFVLRVENLSHMPVTALVAVAKGTLPNGKHFGATRILDSVVNSEYQHSVGRDQVYTFEFWGRVPVRRLNGQPVPVTKQAELKAAIFADGTTWGDPVWIAGLLRRRAEALKYSDDVIAKLKTALSEGTPIKELANEIHIAKADANAAHHHALDEQVAGQVYDTAIVGLQLCDKQSIPQKACIGQLYSHFSRYRGGLYFSRPSIAFPSRPGV